MHEGQQGKGAESCALTLAVKEGVEDRDEDTAAEGEVERDLFQCPVVEVAVGAEGEEEKGGRDEEGGHEDRGG